MNRHGLTTLLSAFLLFPIWSDAQISNHTKLRKIALSKGGITASEWNEFYAAAEGVSYTYGIPLDVIIGISLHETGFFTSTLSQQGYNCFGIKAIRDWTGPIIYQTHTDYFPDTRSWQSKGDEKFRRYSNITESVKDFPVFISKSWYSRAWASEGVKEWLSALNDIGYATSPTWKTEIYDLLYRYEL